MEEISSLDSFHTDGGDSMPRPESETLKNDEETSQTSIDKPTTTTTPRETPTPTGDPDATTKDSSKEESAVANIDEDFEQISEGTFDVDDNSRPASLGPTGDEGTEENVKLENNEAEGEVNSEAAKDQSTNEKTDFEEVDASVNVQSTEAEESDMLGESDMTLPTNDEGAAGEKSAAAMDVDEDEEEEQKADIADADVEMPSISNSPVGEKEAPKSTEPANENGPEEGEGSLVSDAKNESVNADISRDDVDPNNAEDDLKEDADVNETKEDESVDAPKEVVEKEKEATDEADKTTADANEAEEEEAEQEDEPVENVQEPEESDVCLIPDDTETQMTEAEKEQAILARENAEKEDAEAEAEKEKEKESEAAAAAKDAETEAAAAKESGENESEKGTEAQAKAGAEVAADGSEAPTTDSTDAPDPDEPLLEEMQSTAGGDTGGGTSKIIIAWVVSTTHKCVQCGEEEKLCGFRYKNPDTSEWEYICDQSCSDALLTENPGKYFIRRKKFLVEELSSESSKRQTAGSTDEKEKPDDAEGVVAAVAAGENAEKSTAEQGDSATDTNETASTAVNVHQCLQCKESKTCKYFFKQDDESFYICNDDCFNLLSAEEPDKFKLKRHSIRVRNIGATTISSSITRASKATSGAESRVVARTAAEAEAARLERAASFTRRCAECFNEVILGDKNLLWETMDFCNEICLGKYQRTIGANCQTCHGDVPHPALGKYCVRFGFDIRQFCCAACLNEFKKGLKTCSCCQKDISSGNEGFLAPVGDKEQFKDFCSQACMRRYDSMCNPKKKARNDYCAVCNNDKPVRVEIVLDDKEHNFCSNPCFSAFKFVSNIVADQCGMCCKYFERKGSESFTIYTERRPKVFCSRICLNVYIIVNRRIVSCQWCKVKKYNFDMIYKQQDSEEVLMCSLNCLTLYGVSINAFSRAVTKCDNCTNTATPQYHLTMSDSSIRNFCTYQCVMQFQSQFARAPLTLDSEASQQTTTSGAKNSGAPFPTGLPKRVKLKNSQQNQKPLQIKLPTNNKKGPTMPVISTVSSLASGETETRIGNVIVRRSRGRGRKMDSPPPLAPVSNLSTPVTGSGRGRPRKTIDYARSPSPAPLTPPPPPSSSSSRGSNKRSASTTTVVQKQIETETKIITVPSYPPIVRNVQTSCKPQTVTVGFQCDPSTSTVGTQTDKDYSNKVLIPVPVPIYIPQPLHMYSAPFPVPVPIPLPIPVPIFVPTTRNSAQGILKEIKKIQDKMPADPFEAELLMMAEMVAEEKHESDSDSDDEIKPDPGVVSMQYGNNVQQVEVANNSYGEDVLQMALKMATGDYDQPTVDLESAMTANTITNPPPGMVTHDDSMSHMSAHHMQQQQQQHHLMDTQRGGRGRKRGAIATPVSPRNSRSPVKRSRLQEIETSPQTPPQPMQPVEKPDANMCLKYTFGVNAWKQWVMTKNADIEKSTIRRRTFKTELLQMTADELNYSLCLFVKEVRKPNGTEYAPDTIYYLVLGIQQYLYENGRIDNIFTDPYYERFTDCLDEVARKFSVLYNDSQYIVTRVEEEHLWECKQLGAHSPHVLLSTLMFFNTKHFNLTTVEEHMQLSFSHIMKHWKRTAQNAKTPGTRNVLLRFYPPQAGLDANPRKKKVYEQQENEENPLRCPVRLYEFYLSKCPESVKTRNDVFYLQPERSCVPDSPVWYSTQALSQEALQKMLHRVKMVKEINIALLTS